MVGRLRHSPFYLCRSKHKAREDAFRSKEVRLSSLCFLRCLLFRIFSFEME